MKKKPTTTKAPLLRVMLDLRSGEGIKEIRIFASDVNLRDEGNRRLMEAMPILEMLEEKLREPLPPIQGTP